MLIAIMIAAAIHGFILAFSLILPLGPQNILVFNQGVMFAASVSLFNPHAIMDTVGVIDASSLSYQGLDKLAFTFATILVSWIWFLGLALLGRLTGRIERNGNFIIVINKISAVIMWGAAASLLQSLRR